jgi:hypothetical protein
MAGTADAAAAFPPPPPKPAGEPKANVEEAGCPKVEVVGGGAAGAGVAVDAPLPPNANPGAGAAAAPPNARPAEPPPKAPKPPPPPEGAPKGDAAAGGAAEEEPKANAPGVGDGAVDWLVPKTKPPCPPKPAISRERARGRTSGFFSFSLSLSPREATAEEKGGFCCAFCLGD